MQSETTRRWLPALGDPMVVDFVSALSDEDSIIPLIDPTYGLRYPKAETALGKGPKETLRVLDDLVKQGVLTRKAFTKDIGCPSCGGWNISTTYRCIRCSSINIAKNALIEHVPCGNIGPKDTFQSLGQPMVCPHCNVELEDGSHRNIGSWYECLDCKRRIASPEPRHICRNCSTGFTFENAHYDEIHSFSLKEGVKDKVKKFTDIYQPVRDLLGADGYKSIGGNSLMGSSGVRHEFALLVSKNGLPMAVEIAMSDEPISQGEVVQWFAKVIDTKAVAYFIALPGLDPIASKLASAYKLKVIEATSPDDGASKLLPMLSIDEGKLER